MAAVSGYTVACGVVKVVSSAGVGGIGHEERVLGMEFNKFLIEVRFTSCSSSLPRRHPL